MRPDESNGGWATGPQDTRERTCECGPGGMSVLHTLRVARHPDSSTVTVTRTYEATVEWTADLSLSAWLRAVAEVTPPYAADRFGERRGEEFPAPESGGPDAADDRAGVPDAEGAGADTPEAENGTAGSPPDGAGADGRFRAAPVDATVRPAGDHPAGLGDPYHYWNTPLARLLVDDEYPAGVRSMTLDLLGGPDALWSADATAGVDPTGLPGTRTDYARVGLEFTARERYRRPVASDRRPVGGANGDGGPDPWERAGDPEPPATDRLGPLAEATLAFPARESALDGDLEAAVAAVESRVATVWEAFRRRDGDPYAIPDRAVETATEPLDP